MSLKEIIEKNLVLEETNDLLEFFNLGKSDNNSKFGLFVGPEDWFLGLGLNKNLRLCDGNNKYEEIGYFIASLANSNLQAILRLFYCRADKYDKILDPLFDIKDKFVTIETAIKLLKYSNSIFEKAKGIRATLTIPNSRIEEFKSGKIRDILDFCFIPDDVKQKTVKEFLEKYKLKEEHCAAVCVKGCVETYALFYDWAADPDIELTTFIDLYCKDDVIDELRFAEYRELKDIIAKKMRPLNFDGFISYDRKIKCRPIPSSEDPITIFQFNSQAYNGYLADYKKYIEWQSSNTKQFGSEYKFNYNGEVMMEVAIYLLLSYYMLTENKLDLSKLSQEDNMEFLLKIKNNEKTYGDVIMWVGQMRRDIDDLRYTNHTLPKNNSGNGVLLNRILTDIRKESYKNDKGGLFKV